MSHDTLTTIKATKAAPPRVTKPPAPHIKSESHEIELKFLTSETGFKSSQQWPALNVETRRRNAQRLRTIYFDTENADLERHKMVLRIRSLRRGYLMTMKWNGSFPGGMFQRGEIEVPTTLAEPDIALLGSEISDLISSLTEGRQLVPVYETDIKRISRRIFTETSEIEVAFDAGFIFGGEHKSPVREIELELKSGDPAELYRLGIALAETYPVRLGMLAKSERGAMLRTGNHPSAMRSTAPLTGSPSVDEAISALVSACIGQFAGNWPAFEDGDSVNAVHQMRVAMRRLRSMLGLFQRAFPCAEFLSFRAEAKRLASAMGEARNWDVFLAMLHNGPAAAFAGQPGFETITAQAEQRRLAGYETISTLLTAPETTRFILTVQAYVAKRGWRNTQCAEALSRLTEPAINFAHVNLNRLHKKLLKTGKEFATLSPHERHQVRIELKKLRYAADLFGSLFERQTQVRDYTRAAGKLQDQLGIFNDLMAATNMLTLLNTTSPEANHAAGIINGWCAHGATQDNTTLQTTWKKFRKAKMV